MKLLEQLKKYVPFNEQEERDKELIIELLEKNDNIYSRDNKCYHITASSWIVNKDYTKVLMVYHNIYNSFSWTGGHADGEKDLLSVALREAKEETSLCDIKILDQNIYSIESLTVDGHIKKGKYVSSHLHINFTFLLMGDENKMIKPKLDENKVVKWIDINELDKEVNEIWFLEHIYSKLNQKLEVFKKCIQK